MSFTWEYPIYLLPHDQGYASLVDAGDGQPSHSLIVCTDSQSALDLMAQFSMLSAPRALRNDREFTWLLQSLREPVTGVAFNPSPTDDAVNAKWQVSVNTLLTDHLQADRSPWDYPVYAIGQSEGFACIDAGGSAGATELRAEQVRAIGIFTSKESAESYLRDADEEGDLLELANLEDAVIFLDALQSQLAAVAINPHVVDDRRAAEHCLAIDVLLTKYLVRDS